MSADGFPGLGPDIDTDAFEDQVLAAVERDDCTGICCRCGAERGQCEPDARLRKCESCGAYAVYGAEEYLFRLPGFIS